MSSKISSVLVQQSVVTVNELQDALALQVVRGGTLDTALLELELVDEAALLGLLGQALDCLPLEAEMLAAAGPQVANHVPVETAERLGVCPLLQQGAELQLLCCELSDPSAISQLAQDLQCEIVRIASTELRVEQARSTVYGAKLPTRYERLIERLGERPPPPAEASMPPSPPSDDLRSEPPATEPSNGDSDPPPPSQQQSIESVPTRLRLEAAASLLDPQGSNPPSDESSESGVRDDARTAAADHAPSAREASVASQLTALPIDVARGAMLAATDRDEILKSLLRGAHHFLPALRLYALRKGKLVGLYALDKESFDEQLIRQSTILLTSPSVLSRSVAEGIAHVGPTPDTDATNSVLLSADILAAHLAVIPLRLRGKTLCVLVGFSDDVPLPAELLAPLTQLSDHAAEAMARLILIAKQKARRDATDHASPDPQAGGDQGAVTTSSPPPVVNADAPRSAEEQNLVTHDEAFPAGVGRSTSAPSNIVVALDVAVATMSIDQISSALQDHSRPADDLLAELRNRGESAIDWLLSHFPGEVPADIADGFDLFAADPEARPTVSECSAVLRALVYLGRPILLRLPPVLRHTDWRKRFFAAYLLSTMPFPEAVAMLAGRLYDEQLEVKRAAVYGLDALRQHEGFPALLQALRTDLSHPDARPQHAAVKALAALGDTVATPSLIALLTDDRAELVSSAENALVMLTKKDLGPDREAWREWWNVNRHQQRTEWLIDGLVSSSSEVRLLSGLELHHLSGFSDGYRQDLPPRERERVRQRYLEWWEQEQLKR